ncbi:hypothetical protein NP493_41g06080 [Ridgeia piscesae]|uniref:Uncharacterized protein n=1 Tax=Ridgeia piscesae TaxID=27915 RepID=A0AAD9PC83_RIDPI|nr:hypothetical protein NP493_41g06080 [Ridgeia piscesae]
MRSSATDVTLTTDVTGEFVKWSGEHDHPPDIAKCEVTKDIASMRKRAQDEPHIPVQQIYNAEYAQKESVVREHVRSVAALTQLRPADVHEGWMALMEVCPTEQFP